MKNEPVSSFCEDCWQALCRCVDADFIGFIDFLNDMKEEVRRLEIVKRELIQENKRMNPEWYVR